MFKKFRVSMLSAAITRKINESIYKVFVSRWPRGLRRRSEATWLLGSLVRIPLGAWMSVCCVYMLCCPV
jgi:hypothetical protein